MADTKEATVRSLRYGTDHRTKWYPISIGCWDEVLNSFSYDGNQILPDKDIRKNIAYNLQYLEYLEQTIAEISLSAVLVKQTYKSYIIVAVLDLSPTLLTHISPQVALNSRRAFMMRPTSSIT
jgi:hypothetical protein